MTIETDPPEEAEDSLVKVRVIRYGELEVEVDGVELAEAMSTPDDPPTADPSAPNRQDLLNALVRTEVDEGEIELETVVVLPDGRSCDLSRLLAKVRPAMDGPSPTASVAAVLGAAVPDEQCPDCVPPHPCTQHLAEAVVHAYAIERLTVLPVDVVNRMAEQLADRMAA